MKTILIRYSLLLPALLFFIWIGLTLFGCISCFFGAGSSYYCTSYCLIAKISVGTVLGAYFLFFVRDMIRYHKS